MKRYALGFDLTDQQESYLSMLNSDWARRNAVNYLKDPSASNAFMFSLSESISQWSNPYLVVGGLSAGIAGFRASPARLVTPRNYPVRPHVPGTRMPRTLQPGETLGRYGSLDGKWASPHGTAFEARSIPSYLRAGGETKLKVVKPLKVNQSLSNPGELPYQSGYGVQYEFSQPISTYIPEYIQVVK